MTENQPYAVIASGGKQYIVKVGDVIDVELISSENEAFECRDVLFYSDGAKGKVGKPLVAKAVVRGVVMGEVRGPKVIAYKYKKRKKLRLKKGHRQDYTRIRITELVA